MKDITPFIPFSHLLADGAGEVIRRHFRQPFLIEHKEDASPVTLADREAEETMRQLIREHFPEHGIIGEEGGMHQGQAEYLWVLDPIDGTASFIAGRPLFTTLIALCRRQPSAFGELTPLLGIIDQPILRERWVGDSQQTTCNGQPCHTRDSTSLRECILATTSPELFSVEGKAFFDQTRRQVRQTIYGGDAYNYALLASGQLDLVIEEGLKPYDLLALIPVIEGAGGTVRLQNIKDSCVVIAQGSEYL